MKKLSINMTTGTNKCAYNSSYMREIKQDIFGISTKTRILLGSGNTRLNRKSEIPDGGHKPGVTISQLVDKLATKFQLLQPTPMFQGSNNQIRLMRMLLDLTGSVKSKMVVIKPEVTMFQLVDKIYSVAY